MSDTRCNLSQVGTEHVLLGLVAESPPSTSGYLDSGISLEEMKLIVEAHSIVKRASQAAQDASREKRDKAEVPFTKQSKRVFEAALMVSCFVKSTAWTTLVGSFVQLNNNSVYVQESRRLNMNFIAPEHILLALLVVGDADSQACLDK